MDAKTLQANILQAAIALCDSAAYLPDGNAQVPSDLANNLGEALLALAEVERAKYKQYFVHPDQQGLNSAQVALQRLGMPDDELAVERAIDAADQLYLALFDEVVVPGEVYLARSQAEVGEVQFLPKQAIEDFLAIADKYAGS